MKRTTEEGEALLLGEAVDLVDGLGVVGDGLLAEDLFSGLQ